MQLRENVTRSGQIELALDLVRGNAESVIAARRKRQFLGHGTLQALAEEFARGIRAFKGFRERATHRKQITPSIKP